MTDPEPGTGTGASGSDPSQNGKAPKFELKDGAHFIDGRKVVYESDLIAAKKSLEGQLTQQQTAHSLAIDTAKLEVSDAQKQIAQLNARLTETQQARETGAASDTDVARVRQELETAKSGLESASKQILELRRANIILASKGMVSAEQLKDKTLPQLDAFEEVLKTLAPRGSPGPYATGSGSGSAAPETPMERATRILATTPVRGTRTAETK